MLTRRMAEEKEWLGAVLRQRSDGDRRRCAGSVQHSASRPHEVVRWHVICIWDLRPSF